MRDLVIVRVRGADHMRRATGAIEDDLPGGILRLRLGHAVPKARRTGGITRHDVRCSCRKQHDVTGDQFTRRLARYPHPEPAGHDGVERGTGRLRNAQTERRVRLQMRHQRAAHAQHVENVVQGATLFRAPHCARNRHISAAERSR